MTLVMTQTSPRKASLIAGVSYVMLFFLGVFANFFVREGLIVPDDAEATLRNIVDSELLFRAGLVSFLAIFVLDILIAWALYILFKTVSEQLSLITAWFRLVYTVFLGVALIFFFSVLQLVGGASYLAAFDQSQLDAVAMLLLEAFNYAWLIGLACFGIHLMLLGYMILASRLAHRALGILLAIAGAAYLIDTVANAVISNYSDYETLFLVLVAVPAIVGELAFTIWLLARGGVEKTRSTEPGHGVG